MRNILFILSILLFAGLASCQKNEQQKLPETQENGEHKAVVSEILQANSYTYLKVNDNGSQRWLATVKQEIKTGTTIYYKPDLEMKNFESKELKRTFDSIYFVSFISEKPLKTGMSSMMTAKANHQKTAPATDISVKQPKGGISIAQLSSKRTSYEGKIITIRGQVTKYNPSILDRNWVHVQDGTKDGPIYDLTITTTDVVKKGDIVTFKGKVVLNKDFGAGYKYDIILVEATLQ